MARKLNFLSMMHGNKYSVAFTLKNSKTKIFRIMCALDENEEIRYLDLKFILSSQIAGRIPNIVLYDITNPFDMISPCIYVHHWLTFAMTRYKLKLLKMFVNLLVITVTVELHWFPYGYHCVNCNISFQT